LLHGQMHLIQNQMMMQMAAAQMQTSQPGASPNEGNNPNGDDKPGKPAAQQVKKNVSTE